MKCPTGKGRFRTELDAKIAFALMRGRRHTRRGKDEKRWYRCRMCRGWHFTSQDKRRKGGGDVGGGSAPG